MATVQTIVTAALQKAGIVAIEEQPEAADNAKGLEALNFMLSGWKLHDVDITHTDLALTDTFPLADEFREGTVYMLASRVSPDYMVPQSFDADAWFRAIQAAYVTIDESALPTGLSSLPSGIGLSWYQ